MNIIENTQDNENVEKKEQLIHIKESKEEKYKNFFNFLKKDADENKEFSIKRIFMTEQEDFLKELMLDFFGIKQEPSKQSDSKHEYEISPDKWRVKKIDKSNEETSILEKTAYHEPDKISRELLGRLFWVNFDDRNLERIKILASYSNFKKINLVCNIVVNEILIEKDTVYKEELKKLLYILINNENFSDKVNPKYQQVPLLHRLCETDYFESCVKKMIENGDKNLNMIYKDRTPLVLAMLGNNYNLAKVLLNNPRTQVTLAALPNEIAFHILIYNFLMGHEVPDLKELINLFIKHPTFNCNVTDSEGITPLYLLTLLPEKNFDDEIKALLRKKNIKPNIQSKKNKLTPLFIAFEKKQLNNAKILLNSQKINVMEKNIHNRTALEFFYYKCQNINDADFKEISDLIIGHKSFEPNFLDSENGESALHFFSKYYDNKSFNIVKKLLERKDINLNVQEQLLHFTPLMTAACVNNIKLIDLFLDHPDINIALTSKKASDVEPNLKLLLGSRRICFGKNANTILNIATKNVTASKEKNYIEKKFLEINKNKELLKTNKKTKRKNKKNKKKKVENNSNVEIIVNEKQEIQIDNVSNIPETMIEIPGGDLSFLKEPGNIIDLEEPEITEIIEITVPPLKKEEEILKEKEKEKAKSKQSKKPRQLMERSTSFSKGFFNTSPKDLKSKLLLNPTWFNNAFCFQSSENFIKIRDEKSPNSYLYIDWTTIQEQNVFEINILNHLQEQFENKKDSLLFHNESIKRITNLNVNVLFNDPYGVESSYKGHFYEIKGLHPTRRIGVIPLSLSDDYRSTLYVACLALPDLHQKKNKKNFTIQCKINWSALTVINETDVSNKVSLEEEKAILKRQRSESFRETMKTFFDNLQQDPDVNEVVKNSKHKTTLVFFEKKMDSFRQLIRPKVINSADVSQAEKENKFSG